MSGAPQPRTLEVHGRLWGTQARDWADFMEGTCRPVFEAALDRTGVGPGTRYLDVGCGSGMAAAMAAARGADVSGVDAAEGMLSIARERVANGDFRRGDLEDLPFADDTFDVVTGINAFQYAGNPVAALSEAGRVAKRDGRVVVAAFGNPDGMGAATLIGALAPLLAAAATGNTGTVRAVRRKRLAPLRRRCRARAHRGVRCRQSVDLCRRNGGHAWPELDRQCRQGNGKHQRGGRCRSLRHARSCRFADPTAAITPAPGSAACWRGQPDAARSIRL